MNKSKLQKYIYIIIGVIVILFIYFYWTGKDAPSSTTLEEVSMRDQVAGARILLLLNQVNSLKIDTTLFEEPTYMTLQDYTVEVSPLPVGRVNPFAPVPGAPSITNPSGTSR